jgi:serine protease AprX
MPKLQVLLEVGPTVPPTALAAAAATGGPVVAAATSVDERLTTTADLFSYAESLLADMPGLGVDVTGVFGPVPLAAADPALGPATGGPAATALGTSAPAGRRRRAARARPRTGEGVTPTTSMIVPCEVSAAALAALQDRQDCVVWPNSPMAFLNGRNEPEEDFFGLMDLATSAGGTDCRPFQPGVSVNAIRMLLGIEALWRDGFRGQNIFVGILDEGVHSSYPVVGGHETLTERRWGRARIESHGSMCAADILVAAPAARLYDYPFLGQPSSGGALAMFQAVLDQHRRDGTPHLTNNSYGFVGVPSQAQAPNHEIWHLNHPVHRKVREVVAEGIACFFAAGNCGDNCPSGDCHISGIGPGRSIHASNSLAEVITIAAVNSHHERVGYSSQGPGMFERAKPDVAAYTHFFGNFGPGRPGGLEQPFDNGTSAATPVACGVGAALLSAFANLTPVELKNALVTSAFDVGQPGRDFLTGAGVVNAAAAYQILRAGGRVPGVAQPQLLARI